MGHSSAATLTVPLLVARVMLVNLPDEKKVVNEGMMQEENWIGCCKREDGHVSAYGDMELRVNSFNPGLEVFKPRPPIKACHQHRKGCEMKILTRSSVDTIRAAASVRKWTLCPITGNSSPDTVVAFASCRAP
mmetsp:Transcript_59462/g.141820  ORF Transcript_59462/g.141820 Transcript_59462/m.141820 type:complete len:133 (+) Transcript_59462:799-1197(+)